MAALTPDQVIEIKHALAGFAEILYSYYEELLEQGFSSEQAFKMVVSYQRVLMIDNE